MRRHLLLLLALAFTSSPTFASDINGQASVIDGDTLEIHGQRIRLHGVDAPESRQTCTSHTRRTWRCGQQAALALDEFIGRRPVRCVPREIDRYGRVVAQCNVSNTDLNEWLVTNGWAVAYTQYSTNYVSHQRHAKADGRNIWSGKFTNPAEFRRTGGRPPQSPPVTGCALKGNINSKGVRIVHAPGQQHYERTRIDTLKGERWFCTPAEAEDAGWRPARA